MVLTRAPLSYHRWRALFQSAEMLKPPWSAGCPEFFVIAHSCLNRSGHIDFSPWFGAWCSAKVFLLPMTIKNCSRLCYFLLFVSSAGILCADDAPPDAKLLLQSAHQASDPAAVLPYELHATVVINPGTEVEKKGQIAIYRDHDRSRTELRIEDYQEVKLTLSNKLYIARSTPFPVPLLK